MKRWPNTGDAVAGAIATAILLSPVQKAHGKAPCRSAVGPGTRPMAFCSSFRKDFDKAKQLQETLSISSRWSELHGPECRTSFNCQGQALRPHLVL